MSGLKTSDDWDIVTAMARGWESKSVEDQISAAEAKEEARAKESLTLIEIKKRKRKEGLQQERARLIRQMQEAHKGRYLVLLERALAHVDAELAALEKDATGS